MKYKLQDLIDIELFQNLQDRLNEVCSFPSSIIDNDGNVLTATAWQDLCTKFHRKNKDCERECIKSDQYIRDHLHEADPAVSYLCPHGLVDNAIPIVIDGVHYGSFFTGQFFLYEPDLNFFRAQAHEYEFDEDAYLDAVKKVPIWTYEQLNSYLFFIKGLISVISESGLKKLKEIEHRKQVEISEKRHRSILKSAMDGYWLTDIDGRLLEVNDAYCQMSGYREDELLKMHITDLEAAENPQVVAEHIQKIILHGSDRFESRHFRKDGTVFDVEVSVQFRAEDGEQCVCFIRDITERKQAEEASNRLKERLESLWNITKIADSDITTISNHVLAEVQKITQSQYAFYGFFVENKNEMILHAWSGQTMEDCKIKDKTLHFSVDKAGVWAQAVKEKKVITTNDFHGHHPGKKGTPDGHVSITRLMVVPFIRKDKVISIAAVANKIDPYSKEDAKQVQTFLGSVQLLIERKTAEQDKIKLLTRMQQVQKMESIGNLAGGIAHDFNNILFSIVGMSELLLEDLPEGTVEHENAQEILTAGRRGRDLVKQILAFSRQSDHEPVPVRIQQVLKDVLKLCRATIPAEIKIYQDIQQNCGLVLADSTQIHQVGMNLITNAYHAVAPVNGTISITLKEIEIKREDWDSLQLEAGRYANIVVSDTGTGMDPELFKKIFDPYFTTKKREKGTGLGLAVVHGIVKKYGGGINVYSEPGKGSTFNVYIPLMKKAVEEVLDKQTEMSPKGNERILLVDDEKSISRVESQMLERLGYQVTVFNSSTEALEKFKSNSELFDLVISDLSMPDMTGEKLAGQLLSIRKNIPVILCTGFYEKIDKEKAELMGIKGFLIKPVIKSDMAQTVRKILDENKKINDRND